MPINPFYLLALLSVETYQLAIAAATFVFACVGSFGSAYLGVKVAQARIDATLAAQGQRLTTAETDIRRIEDRLFIRPNA